MGLLQVSACHIFYLAFGWEYLAFYKLVIFFFSGGVAIVRGVFFQFRNRF
jgi:hypothetical protein